MRKNIVLYTLQTFSTTGGIQKMTRTLAHALDTLSGSRQWQFKLKSLYDANTDLMPQYLPAAKFEGFGLRRVRFVLNALFTARQSSVIIISHINLALVGLITKALNPKCRVWLIAHGIEVWRPLSVVQRAILKRCDKVICVSSFTKEKLIAMHGIKADRCEVLNNAVDPFMKLPESFTKPEYLLKRHHIGEEAPVIFTLTRLASSEQYKGHDHVIQILGRLREKFPDIRYVLAGSYDHKEEIRIQKLITEAQVEKEVILTGFIEEAELTDYFLLADLFVLPSKKEGFGIVFIEALACGLPVVCGNADGSIDAIRNGELGTAVNVDDLCELEEAITAYLSSTIKKQKRKKLQSGCLHYFNEDNYMNKLEKMLLNE